MLVIIYYIVVYLFKLKLYILIIINMKDLDKAKNTLIGSTYTLVLCHGDDIFTSTDRGVAPLLKILDDKKDVSLYSAADKVIGNGAAFLYVILGIKNIYSGIISKPALNTLQSNGINIVYDTLVDNIVNRMKTGLCPIESAVSGITDPTEALSAIRKKIAEMKKK